MPTVDEEEQQRETYGTPNPGWLTHQVAVPEGQPMPPMAQPASPPADASAASSAEVSEEPPVQETPSEQATPPPSQAAPETKPWNMPPEDRWNELRRDRDEARRAYQELATRISQAPPAPVAPATPQPDPWEGYVNHPDPATARFYQEQKRLVEHAVSQGRAQAMQELQPVLDNLLRTQTSISVKEFRKENPDIQPGSEEETLVIAYMEGRVDGIKHPIESARNNAVIRRLETEVKTYRAKQATTPAKRQAIQPEVRQGIPQTAGLPPRPGDWRERASAIVDKGGNMVDVARAIFGGGRKPVLEE